MKVIKTNKSKKDISSKVYTLHKLDWLEYVSMGLCFWFLFYPRPYDYLLIALLLLPFVGMFLNGLNKPSIASLVEIDHNAKDEYDVADFIDLPTWVILLRTLLDYETDSYVAAQRARLLLWGFVPFCCLRTNKFRIPIKTSGGFMVRLFLVSLSTVIVR